VRRVTDLVQSLQGKVEELGARLVPTTPQEVHDERKNEVQQLVEVMKKTVLEYETLLGKVAQTWSTLLEDPDKVKIQEEMDEVQQQQNRMKQLVSIMSP